jgi:hypothetical protein
MRNPTLIAVLLAVCGCYAQFEGDSITMSHNLCGASGNCMPGGVPLGVVQVSGQNTFTVSFGDQPLLSPTTDLGPATVKTSLTVNDAAFALQPQAGASFSAVNTVTLLAALNPPATPGADPCATASNCVVIADFDKTRDGAADQRIVLTSKGVDLVTVINASTHDLVLQIQATGTAPGPGAWNADLSMDMALKARANFP